MTEVMDRDFSTFHLGDDVYRLAGGVIPEIAERLEVPISDTPRSDDLQAIVAKVGPNKVLRANEEVEAINLEDKLSILNRSGIQKPLSRSLWTPEISVNDDTIDAFLIMGGVANWTDRAALAVPSDMIDKPVYVLGGNRVMDTGTELPNPNIIAFHDDAGRYPTEAEYLGRFVVPALTEKGFEVFPSQYQTGNADTILQTFFELDEDLLGDRIAVVRVANAGVMMAVQVRDAARQVEEHFDMFPYDAQAFVVTDTLPFADTPEKEKQPVDYQKTDPALRNLVLTAKKLHEATGGE